MSETTPNNTKEAPAKPAHHMTAQEQRWLKYGANVAANCILAAVIVGLLIYIAGKYSARTDVTSSGLFSLKPQTVNIIQGLDEKNKVKLVCLYPKLKKEEVGTQQDFRQTVLDLLEEYRRKGKNIEVQAIDPVNEPTAFDNWIRALKDKYGGDVKGYEAAIKAFPTTLEEIRKIADDEAKRMRVLEKVKFTDENQVDIFNAAYNTVQGFPRLLKMVADSVEEETRATEESKGRIRDYKGQLESVRNSMTSFSRRIGAVVKAMKELQADAKLPKEAGDYAKESIPRLEQMQKKADELLAKIQGLGELKLDDLRKKLNPEDGESDARVIAVMGPEDIKLVAFADVWKSGETAGMPGGTGQIKLRFAGEQRLTASILSLTQTQKTKVAFIRPGGAPLTQPQGMGERGPFQEIADRLRAYNFEVIEKDISGQWAMQSMQRGMPAPPEPSDEEIKNAIWVVLSIQPSFSMMGPNPLAGKVAEHLKNGGSALVLFGLNSDDLSSALKDWGIAVKTDTRVVHETVETAGGPEGDIVEMAKRQAPIFVLNQYGDHPIGQAVQTLDTVFVEAMVVQTSKVNGIKTASFIPTPKAPMYWGEKDLASAARQPTFSESGDNPDIAPPIHIAASAEKDSGGRVVAIGSVSFAVDYFVTFPDQNLQRKYKINVSRFPGNGELLTNSVFWLAKKEAMMALSPAAMEVSRIRPISDGVLAFWRTGVLLVCVPLVVVAMGLWVYFSRRD